MSNALSLEAKRSVVPKKPLSHSIQVGANSLLILVIMLCAVVTFLYLAHANRNATDGYSIKTMQEQKQILTREIQEADMEIANLNSLDYLASAPELANMKPSTGRIAFVGVDTAFAFVDQ